MLASTFALVASLCAAFVVAGPVERRWGCVSTVDGPLRLERYTAGGGNHVPAHDISAFYLKDGVLTNSNGESGYFGPFGNVLYFKTSTSVAKPPRTFTYCPDSGELQFLARSGHLFTNDYYLCKASDAPTSYNVYIKDAPHGCERRALTFSTGHKAVAGTPDRTGRYKLLLFPHHHKTPSYGQTYHHRRSVSSDAPSLSNVEGRSAKPDRLVAATVFQNKSKFLREWIEFHLMTGVSKFLMYDHQSTDSPKTVLQPYIDAGVVEYISWPPAQAWSIAEAPASMTEEDVRSQSTFYRNAMKACIGQEWATHKQTACQFAASVDMLRRTASTAQWVGFWDVDEFIYPTSAMANPSLPDLFDQQFATADYISIAGSNFGTNGHSTVPVDSVGNARLTSNYLRRRALNDETPSPFAAAVAKFVEKSNTGGSFPQKFDLPETFARKAFVRPELAGWSMVHDWFPLPSLTSTWARTDLWLDDARVKLNHYAYLTKDEANAKAIANGNPLAAFNEAQDRFYLAEEDTSIQWLSEGLAQRMA